MSRLADAMRKAIKSGNLTRYALWKLTGIDQGHLSNFMAGKKGLSLEAMELLADALDLEIIIQPAKRRTTSKTKGR